MFWGKKGEKSKDDRGLPDLTPEKPVLFNDASSEEDSFEKENKDGQETWTRDENEEIEKHNLPSFPDSPIQKGFSQSAIKDAVEEDETGERASYRVKEIDEADSSDLPQINEEGEMEDSEDEESISDVKLPIGRVKNAEVGEEYSSKKADIFVKIDRFYSAKKALDSIEIKLLDIEDSLKKIRETKMREEQELSGWEKEIDDVKTKVQDVREKIFEVS